MTKNAGPILLLLSINSLIKSQTLKRIAFGEFLGICCKVRYLLFSFYSTWHEDMSLFRRGVIHPLGENWRSSSIRLTLLNSICKTESSDLVDNTSGMAYTKYQEEKSPRPCSGSEHGTARCSLPRSMFCFCLLRLGLAVTGNSGWKLWNADTRCEYWTVKKKREKKRAEVQVIWYHVIIMLKYI